MTTFFFFYKELNIKIKPEFLLHISEVKSLSRVRLFATPWTVAYQALHFNIDRPLSPLSLFFFKINLANLKV